MHTYYSRSAEPPCRSSPTRAPPCPLFTNSKHPCRLHLHSCSCLALFCFCSPQPMLEVLLLSPLMMASQLMVIYSSIKG